MCWIAKEDKDKIQLTADADIPVYKMLKRNGKTPLGYKPSYEEPLPKVELKINRYSMISEGYHSYATGIGLYDSFGSIEL